MQLSAKPHSAPDRCKCASGACVEEQQHSGRRSAPDYASAIQQSQRSDSRPDGYPEPEQKEQDRDQGCACVRQIRGRARPTPSNRLGKRRRAIEACCPPVLRVWLTASGGALPSARSRCPQGASRAASARHTPQPCDHATTRSGTSSLPLVSGASSSATIKLIAPNTVPTSIGIAKPSCQVVAK